MPNTFGTLSKALETGPLVSLFFLSCYLGENISTIFMAVIKVANITTITINCNLAYLRSLDWMPSLYTFDSTHIRQNASQILAEIALRKYFNWELIPVALLKVPM